jgi:hypothetical protein
LFSWGQQELAVCSLQLAGVGGWKWEGSWRLAGSESWQLAGSESFQSPVGSRQLTEVRIRKSDVKDSRLHAENCGEAKLSSDAHSLRRKTSPLAVRDVGLRPVMTRAKMRGQEPLDKTFRVKLS